MNYGFFIFICTLGLWLYYPSQWLLEGLGYIKALEKLRIYWEFVRFINCIIFPVSLVILYEYIFGEWSIFGGWNMLTEGWSEFQKVHAYRLILGGFLILIVPLMNFILSMTVLFHSYKKIKNPKKNIFTIESY